MNASHHQDNSISKSYPIPMTHLSVEHKETMATVLLHHRRHHRYNMPQATNRTESLTYLATYDANNHFRTQDPYGSNTYGVGYSQVPSGYLPSQGSYGTQFPVSNPSQQAVPLSAEDASGVRVVTARPKPQCWEHGCNGRQFSTFSNLLRHQREKSGTAAKSECPRCGAVFTRTTARNGHLAHDKCKRKSTASASEAER